MRREPRGPLGHARSGHARSPHAVIIAATATATAHERTAGGQPRPANGMAVAITVIVATFASSGSDAM